MTDPIQITDDNFEMAMSQITTSFQMLSLFDWALLVSQRQHADSFMHITDPTGYGKLINSKNADRNMKAAALARDFVAGLSTLTEGAD